MAEKFLMPKLSPTMEEGQISRWVKNEGDTYEANETLAEVDTDKATMEMTALQGGTLLKILKGAGETAALGEAIAITGKKGEDISALLKRSFVKRRTAAKAGRTACVSRWQKPARRADKAETAERVSTDRRKHAAGSERASYKRLHATNERPTDRFADRRTHGGGQRHRSSNRSPVRARTAASSNATSKKRSSRARKNRRPKTKDRSRHRPSSERPPFSDEPTSKMRQVIASRLAESIGPIPTFYLTVEIEMDNTLAVRKQINANLDDDAKDQRQRHHRKSRGDVAAQASMGQRFVSGQERPVL